MCGITRLIHFGRHSSRLSRIKDMTFELRHRGPDDEAYAFFNPRTNSVWAYGGVATPASVYHSYMPYAPSLPISDSELSEATLALGHRRISILDLSPASHQPMCA